MRRAVVLLTLFCFSQLFIACSLLQKTKTSSSGAAMKIREESSKVEQFNTLDKSLGWSRSVSNDSLNAASTVVIWPKGKFSFSPLDGFSGTAAQIMISGTLKKGSKVFEEKIQQKAKYKDSSLMEERFKSIQTDQQDTIKEVFPVFSWWWLWVVIPLLFGLRWLSMNYKRR